jgi:regulatory protein
MPKITAIVPQQKHRERFSLFVDGKFVMGVDGSLVLTFDLKKGLEFDGELQFALENAERNSKAYNGLLNFIGFRERCEHEVHEWLYKHGYSDLEEELVERLKASNYLNDQRFTELFIKDHVRLKGWGPVRIRHVLRSKRIAPELIEAALENIRDVFDFQEMAAKLARQKYQSCSNPTLKDKKRIWAFLQRRGFESAAIRDALVSLHFTQSDSKEH